MAVFFSGSKRLIDGLIIPPFFCTHPTAQPSNEKLCLDCSFACELSNVYVYLVLTLVHVHVTKAYDLEQQNVFMTQQLFVRDKHLDDILFVARH